MAVTRNPDGSLRYGPTFGPPPGNAGYGGTAPSGLLPRPGVSRGPSPGYAGTVVRPVPAAAPPAPAAPNPAADFMRRSQREHILGAGALTPTEKLQRLQAAGYGDTSLVTGNGVTTLNAPGTTVFRGTTASGNGFGGGYGGFGGGGRGVAATPGGGGGFGGYGGVRGFTGGGAAGPIGDQLQRDLDEANAKNEERYQQELGINAQSKADQLGALGSGYGDVYSTLGSSKGEQMGFLNDVLGKQQALTGNFGSTAHERENRRLAEQRGQAKQSLAGRGLGNSTVRDSVLKGLDTDSAFVQNSIDEDTARLNLGLLQNYGNQGIDVMGRNDAALAASKLGYANAVPDTIRQADTQRIGIIDRRTDAGPDVDAYLHQLNQPGSLGPLGYGGFGGGGGGAREFNGNPFANRQGGGYDNGGGGGDPIGDLHDYLAAMGYGGGGYGGGGGGFTPDPRTVAANERVRKQDEERRRQYLAAMNPGNPSVSNLAGLI